MYWKIVWVIKWKSACKQLLLRDVADVKGYTKVQKVEYPSKNIKHKGLLLVQMPSPTDQLLNHILNMVNRDGNEMELAYKWNPRKLQELSFLGIKAPYFCMKYAL